MLGTVLDAVNKVKEIDQSGMLSDLAKTVDYCRDAISRAKKVSVHKIYRPHNIVIIGMGGSAISGEILKDWLHDWLPISIEVCRDYILPAYVTSNTLVIANSYSGNTEETLSAFLFAIHRKCTVLAVTSGGLLSEFCKKLRIPCVLIPSGLQPRVALPYMFFPLPILLQKIGVLPYVEARLNQTIELIENVSKENALDVPLKQNEAKKIAKQLLDKIPIVYGFRQYNCVARRMKTQFNENSKVPSKSESFPELNHNETVGYDTSKSLTKTLSIIVIRDPDESLELKNRIEITTELVFKKSNTVTEITAKGSTKLAKMFSVLILGDYVSVYLAILQNKDPTPVKIIDKVKAELAKKNRMKEHFEAELAKLK